MNHPVVRPFPLDWFRDQPMFRRDGLSGRILPFSLSAIPASAGLIAGQRLVDTPTFIGGICAAVVCVCLALLAPWGRLPRLAEVGPPSIAVISIALLRHGTGSHDPSLSLLTGLVVIWATLFGTGREVLILLGVIGLSLLAPILLVDAPRDVANLLPPAIVMLSAETLVAWLLLSLRASVRAYADDAVEARRQLQEQANHDPLTGLLNRRGLFDALETEVAEARRAGGPVAVVMLDLDHFKRYNDSLGHEAGDALLVRLASAWSALIRPRDRLARLGGEEFVVIMPGSTTAAAVVVAERLLAAVPDGQTCSAGVAQRDGLEALQQTIARADHALYEAKAQGRNRAVIDRVSATSLPLRQPWQPSPGAVAPDGHDDPRLHRHASGVDRARPPGDARWTRPTVHRVHRRQARERCRRNPPW